MKVGLKNRRYYKTWKGSHTTQVAFNFICDSKNKINSNVYDILTSSKIEICSNCNFLTVYKLFVSMLYTLISIW